MSATTTAANISTDVYQTSRQVSVAYLLIVGILGTLGNSLVVFVLWKYPKLRTATNLFILNLAFCDLVMALLDLSLSVASALSNRWLWGKSGCLGYGFLHYFFISNSVSTLAAISVDRFFYITKPGQIKAWRITRTRAGIILIIIYIYVLLFTFPPIAGWSSFTEEKFYFSGCFIKYSDQNPASMAYSVIASVFLYLMPLILMICCYSKIFMAVRKSTRRTMTNSNAVRKKFPIMKRTHIQTAKMIVVVIFFSMIVWVPYVAVSLIQAFTADSIITPTASHITVLVAKSCVIYNVLIYVVLNRKLKAVILNLLCCGRQINFSGSNMPTSNLRISRILSETDREIAPDAVRNRLNVLQNNDNASAVDASVERSSPIPTHTTFKPDLIETPKGTKQRHGNVKTVEFKVVEQDGNVITLVNDAANGTGSGGNLPKIRRKKLPQIPRDNQETNGNLVGQFGDDLNSVGVSNKDFSSCEETSPAKTEKLLLTETVTRAEARRRALRKLNDRKVSNSVPSIEKRDSTSSGATVATGNESHDRSISPSTPNGRILPEIPNHVGDKHEKKRNGNAKTNEADRIGADSSSTAIPSSCTSTLSNHSRAWSEKDTGNPAAPARSMTSPRRNGRRKTRKHMDRNASLRARLQRCSVDVLQASPSELHEIQNYWKRMSLCLDDIDLDEMV
uniref:Opsin n=2 Tax=Nematostella vectensis TaxID=45351 RepID=A9UMX9_NEMVE|nr:TPA: opsin [Nematostella vectensis]